MPEIKTETRKSSGSLNIPKATQALQPPAPVQEKSVQPSQKLTQSTLPASSLVLKLRQKLLAKSTQNKTTSTQKTQKIPTLVVAKNASVFDRLITYLAYLISMIDHLIFGKIRNFISRGKKVTVVIPKEPTEQKQSESLEPVADPALEQPHWDDDNNSKNKKRLQLPKKT